MIEIYSSSYGFWVRKIVIRERTGKKFCTFDAMRLADLGLLGLFIGTFMAGSVVPFSSDVLYVAILAAFGQRKLACLVVAVLGNSLGAFSTYFIGRLAKTDRIERWLRVSPQSVEAQKEIVCKWGVWAALIGWVPVVGKPILIALGIYKSKAIPTMLLTFAGIAMRFGIWTLVLMPLG